MQADEFVSLLIPLTFVAMLGFDAVAATRLAPMLLGRDVNAAQYGRASLGRDDARGTVA